MSDAKILVAFTAQVNKFYTSFNQVHGYSYPKPMISWMRHPMGRAAFYAPKDNCVTVNLTLIKVDTIKESAADAMASYALHSEYRWMRENLRNAVQPSKVQQPYLHSYGSEKWKRFFKFFMDLK